MVSRELHKPTRGQLERALSQQIQKLYRQELGHSTGKIVCQLRDNQLNIVIECSLTQPEQLLLEGLEPERVEKLHSDLDNLVRPKLINLVEETLDQKVLDLMGDTTIETGRTGFIVVLADDVDISNPDERDFDMAQAS